MAKRSNSSKPATPSVAQQAQAASVVNGATQQAAPDVAAIGANTAAKSSVKGAKQFIRELLSVEGAKLTLDDLCKASGKTPVNVRTMLSDLRSPKYAGKAGVFKTTSAKGEDGKTYYMKAAS